MAEWQTQLTQNQPVTTLWVRLPPLVPIFSPENGLPSLTELGTFVRSAQKHGPFSEGPALRQSVRLSPYSLPTSMVFLFFKKASLRRVAPAGILRYFPPSPRLRRTSHFVSVPEAREGVSPTADYMAAAPCRHRAFKPPHCRRRWGERGNLKNALRAAGHPITHGRKGGTRGEK